jgi:hypothetical protein
VVDKDTWLMMKVDDETGLDLRMNGLRGETVRWRR